jgi:hypothetical protein
MTKRKEATEVADLGYGFQVLEVTPEEKEALEAASFEAECDAHADALFGPLGDSAKIKKRRLVAEAIEKGAKMRYPVWYTGDRKNE